ncbi:hypothetical protein CRE_04942 [Caenorhabditis remanei]|uniref:Uncharacterized protein n=1 Tax=Caenorhabditis remanei TaxID=31234 RepID=E3MNG8_CAERE|nr:hypothetical protein CRE_04942 [Caenorhabditis remanei]
MTQSVPPGDMQTKPTVKIAKVINPSARPPNGVKTTNKKDPMFCRPSYPLSIRITSRTTVSTSSRRTPQMVPPSNTVVSGPNRIWIRKGKRLCRTNEDEKQK